jgi:hypothetical protein
MCDDYKIVPYTEVPPGRVVQILVRGDGTLHAEIIERDSAHYEVWMYHVTMTLGPRTGQLIGVSHTDTLENAKKIAMESVGKRGDAEDG